MSRLFVKARAAISFNLFSSACKRRSISPVWAEANWPNLDEPDITVSFFLMSFVLKKRQLDPVCSRILRAYKLFDAILRPRHCFTAAGGGSERSWLCRNALPEVSKRSSFGRVALRSLFSGLARP